MKSEARKRDSKFVAVIRLSRWREHVPFTIPLTLFGGLLALEPQAAAADWRLFAVLAGNVLAMSFAFMLNNIEDARDDALDPQKMRRNVISNGELSRREGVWCTLIAFALALGLYLASGVLTLIIGGVTLALCYLYSAHPFRFKARPLTDVVSHALMLSGLLVAVGYFTYGAEPGEVWLVIAAASLFSAYGQFYNQVVDYKVDKEAGLKNTAVLLGKGSNVNSGAPVHSGCAALHARRHLAGALSSVARHDTGHRRHHNSYLPLGNSTCAAIWRATAEICSGPG